MFLKEEISYKRIEEQLQNPILEKQIYVLENIFTKEYAIFFAIHFGTETTHFFFTIENNFNEKDIPTKGRPIQMNL